MHVFNLPLNTAPCPCSVHSLFSVSKPLAVSATSADPVGVYESALQTEATFWTVKLIVLEAIANRDVNEAKEFSYLS